MSKTCPALQCLKHCWALLYNVQNTAGPCFTMSKRLLDPAVRCPKYYWALGSIVSENRGMNEETHFQVLHATVSLNKYSAIWNSEMTLRQKVRFLKTHVFPSLVYASECGNHTQKEVSMIGVFLNMCRRRLLGVGRCKADGTVIKVEELKRRCRLPEPLDLLSRRRINFITKVVVRPTSMEARHVLFSQISTQPGDGSRNVSGRDRSSYANVLKHDLEYLYSGQAAKQSINRLMSLARRIGLEQVQKALKALKPDKQR